MMPGVRHPVQHFISNFRGHPKASHFPKWAVLNYKMGSSKYKMGSFQYKMGNYKYKMGSYKYKTGSSKYKIGSSKYKMGSYKYKMGSSKYKMDSSKYKMDSSKIEFLTFLSFITFRIPIKSLRKMQEIAFKIYWGRIPDPP